MMHLHTCCSGTGFISLVYEKMTLCAEAAINMLTLYGIFDSSNCVEK